MKARSHGFTVLELIFVVMVVGVLAVVAIFAYTSIRQQAKDQGVAAAFNVYRAAINKFKQNNGTYPPSSNQTATGYDQTPLYYGACLGNDFPAADNFGEGDCLSVGGATQPYAHTRTSLNDDLQLIMGGTLPSSRYAAVRTDSATAANTMIRGIVYGAPAMNGIVPDTASVWLAYGVADNDTCAWGSKNFIVMNGGGGFMACVEYLQRGVAKTN